jgi:glycosyltransferase involved in cell wall biosynthesis
VAALLCRPTRFLCIVKILILHQHYNSPESGGAIRSYYLATALVQAGHQVTVVAAHGQHQQTDVRTAEGFELVLLPVPYQNEFRFWSRARAFLHFAWAAIKVSSQFRDFDFCYAISTPLTIGLPACWLKWRYGIPFMFEVGDLWPEAPIQLGFVRNPLLRWLLRSFESFFYRQSTAVVALSLPIQAAVRQRAPYQLVHLLPNMADTDYYQPSAKAQELETKYSVAGKFVVSYLGALGFANGLDFLLECANACRKADAPVHFLVGGAGAEEKRLRNTAEQLGLSNISFLGLLARPQVREVLAVTDAVMISYRAAPILETGSPNKYFDGLAAGKLVVINFGGWMKQEIESERCGLWVNPQQPSEFVTKLQPFWQQPTLLADYQVQARRLAVRKYARTDLATSFAKFFKK